MTSHPLLTHDEQHPDPWSALEQLLQEMEATSWDFDVRPYGPQASRVAAFLRRMLTLSDEEADEVDRRLTAAGRPHVVGGTKSVYDLEAVMAAVRRSDREAAYRTAWNDGLAVGFKWDGQRMPAYELDFYWNFRGFVAEFASNLASALVVVDLVGEAALQPLLGCVARRETP